MPIYSYLCKNCGNTFDLLVGVVAKQEELKCKKCNSKNIEKTLGTFSVGVGSKKLNDTGSSCPTGTCPL